MGALWVVPCWDSSQYAVGQSSKNADSDSDSDSEDEAKLRLEEEEEECDSSGEA